MEHNIPLTLNVQHLYTVYTALIGSLSAALGEKCGTVKDNKILTVFLITGRNNGGKFLAVGIGFI
jgi:hypothetical protein